MAAQLVSEERALVAWPAAPDDVNIFQRPDAAVKGAVKIAMAQEVATRRHGHGYRNGPHTPPTAHTAQSPVSQHLRPPPPILPNKPRSHNTRHRTRRDRSSRGPVGHRFTVEGGGARGASHAKRSDAMRRRRDRWVGREQKVTSSPDSEQIVT